MLQPIAIGSLIFCLIGLVTATTLDSDFQLLLVIAVFIALVRLTLERKPL